MSDEERLARRAGVAQRGPLLLEWRGVLFLPRHQGMAPPRRTTYGETVRIQQNGPRDGFLVGVDGRLLAEVRAGSAFAVHAPHERNLSCVWPGLLGSGLLPPPVYVWMRDDGTIHLLIDPEKLFSYMADPRVQHEPGTVAVGLLDVTVSVE